MNLIDRKTGSCIKLYIFVIFISNKNSIICTLAFNESLNVIQIHLNKTDASWDD